MSMHYGVISPQVEPEAHVASGHAPWGYAMPQPQPQPQPQPAYAPTQQQLAQAYAGLQQQVWPLLVEAPAAYLQAPMPISMHAPAVAPVHPALMPRGGLTRSPSRRDGVFTLAVTLVVLMITLAGAVALEGGLVRHDTPAPSSPAPIAAVAAPAPVAAPVAAPAPAATVAPAVG
ncbi:MAG: hypothetical protein H7287_06010 [Thermoleophilia bacterium]|nr:hypothetical protein [Thermoleophilia bacterium]